MEGGRRPRFRGPSSPTPRARESWPREGSPWRVPDAPSPTRTEGGSEPGPPAFRSPVNDSDRESHDPRAQHPRERGHRPASASDARPLRPAPCARSPPSARRSAARTTIAGRWREKGSQRGRRARPWAPQPAPRRQPPPKRPFSPRGGLGVVPTEVASGEAPRVPPSIPLCGPEWYGPMGRGAGPTAPGWRPVAKAVAQRGRGGGGAWAPSLPCTRPKARGRAGAGHAGSGECAGAPSIAVATSLFAPSSPLEGSGWRKMREAGG